MIKEILIKNRIKNQGLGIALGGGASRGFFHIGVLQALEDYKIPIKHIAGISIGSLVGGLYAMGYSAKEVLDFMSKYADVSTLLATLSPTLLDKKGFLRSDKLVIEINKLAGNKPIEKLKIPFVCRAADLMHFKEVIFDKGDIGRAIKASCTIPGVFVPEQTETEVLVDGGVLGSVPLKLLKSYFKGPTLASNLISYNNISSTHAQEIMKHFSDNIFYKILPVSDLVLRSFYLMQSHMSILEYQEYTPDIDIEFHGSYDPSITNIADIKDDLVQDGYNATESALKKLGF